MSGVSPADILALLARLAFVVLLYAFVFAVLWALRRSVRTAAPIGSAGVDAPSVLTLSEAAPVDGPVGRVVPLDRPLLIGRRPDCEVMLQDDAVSGHHARLSWDTNRWQVEDLKSTNGTYLNTRRVRGRAGLKAGDVVTIGNSQWTLS